MLGSSFSLQWVNSDAQMQLLIANIFSLHRGPLPISERGWSDVVKLSCILGHWGVQLILAYSWARPAILVASKGRGGMFLFLLFLHFHSCSPSSLSLSFIFCTISSASFLPFSGRRHKMIHKGWRVIKPEHNQSIYQWIFTVKHILNYIQRDETKQRAH